jgi:hypothetical protein
LAQLTTPAQQKKRFSFELRLADGAESACRKVIRKVGISGLETDQTWRMKQFQERNSRLN